MSGIVKKAANIPRTLWEHKKKTALGCFLLYLGGNYGARAYRNSKIRAEYAQLAVKYGQQTMSAEDSPRRVTVLANIAANERSCFDDFTKNALPLFHLAGIVVDIIKSESDKQLESLAAALDNQEADAVYIVGGDGTIGRVVTGILLNREQSVLPIGVFPGGYDNLALRRLVPEVFNATDDVRRYCESALALIEDVRTPIRAYQFRKEGSDENPVYGIGDVGAGWFRHIENKRKKLWYFGGMKRRWAYIWEMLKRSPQDMEVVVKYTEDCSGCNRCKPAPIVEIPQWRWWHMLAGTPKIQQTKYEKDYSQIENENCGRLHEIAVSGTDLIVENEQIEAGSRLLLRIGGQSAGRFGVISEGMERCASNIVGTSKNSGFYSSEIIGSSIQLQFQKIAEFISQIYVSGEAIKIDQGESVTVSKTDKVLQLFLPKSLRIDIASL